MFEKCIYFALNAGARDLSRFWDAGFRRLGLTTPQAYMLVFVIRHPGASQNDISKAMNLEKSTVTRTLEGLERLKLVFRASSSADARVVEVKVTAKGRSLEQKIVGISRELNARLRESVKAEEIDQLIGLTQLLLDRAESESDSIVSKRRRSQVK